MKRREGGATIIELLVAVIILAVGLLPLVLALNRIYTDAYRLGTRAEAQLLAAEKIDEFKADGFLDVSTDTLGTKVSVTVDEGALSRKPYYRSTTVTYQKYDGVAAFTDAATGDSATDYIKVQTTVSWKGDTTVFYRTVTGLLTKEGAFE